MAMLQFDLIKFIEGFFADSWSEMETGLVYWHRSGWPAGRVAGLVEILRPAGQAGWKTGRILLSGN